MEFSYKEACPPLKHPGLREAKWLWDKKGLIITASDGVWLYKDPIRQPDQKELIIYEKDWDLRFNENQIFGLTIVEHNPEWVIYVMREGGYGKLNLKNGVLHPIGNISYLDTIEIRFSPDGKYMILAKFDSGIEIIDFDNGIVIESIDDLTSPISEIYDGSKFLCGINDRVNEVIEYDFLTKKRTVHINMEKMFELNDTEDNGVNGYYLILLMFIKDKILTQSAGEIRLWNNDMSNLIYQWKTNHLGWKPYYPHKDKIFLLDDDNCIIYDIVSGKQTNVPMKSFEFDILFFSTDEIISIYNHEKDRVYFYINEESKSLN